MSEQSFNKFFEAIFDGTPAEFGVLAEELDPRLHITGERYPSDNSGLAPAVRRIFSGIRALRPEANPVKVVIEKSTGLGGSIPRIVVTAIKHGNHKAFLRGKASDDCEPEFMERWEKLVAEMRRLRKIEEVPSAPLVRNVSKKKTKGRLPEFSLEVMYEAVIGWHDTQHQTRRESMVDDLADDEEWEPAERMTKDQYLANRFNKGVLVNMPVKARKLDQWAENFDSGKWLIPEKYKKKKQKRL